MANHTTPNLLSVPLTITNSSSTHRSFSYAGLLPTGTSPTYTSGITIPSGSTMTAYNSFVLTFSLAANQGLLFEVNEVDGDWSTSCPNYIDYEWQFLVGGSGTPAGTYNVTFTFSNPTLSPPNQSSYINPGDPSYLDTIFLKVLGVSGYTGGSIISFYGEYETQPDPELFYVDLVNPADNIIIDTPGQTFSLWEALEVRSWGFNPRSIRSIEITLQPSSGTGHVARITSLGDAVFINSNTDFSAEGSFLFSGMSSKTGAIHRSLNNWTASGNDLWSNSSNWLAAARHIAGGAIQVERFRVWFYTSPEPISSLIISSPGRGSADLSIDPPLQVFDGDIVSFVATVRYEPVAVLQAINLSLEIYMGPWAPALEIEELTYSSNNINFVSYSELDYTSDGEIDVYKVDYLKAAPTPAGYIMTVTGSFRVRDIPGGGASGRNIGIFENGAGLQSGGFYIVEGENPPQPSLPPTWRRLSTTGEGWSIGTTFLESRNGLFDNYSSI